MYRDDLEAALARAHAADRELASAKERGRADVATLEAELAVQRREIDRLQRLVDVEPSRFERLVARGPETEARRDRARGRDARRRRPSRRREALTTTPFGCFATTDALESYALIIFGTSVAAGYLWSLSPSLLPLSIAMPLLVIPVLYAAAWSTSLFTHRAVLRWAAGLPFETNYLSFLARENIESVVFVVQFRDTAPDLSVLEAAIRGLDKGWLAGCAAADHGLVHVRFSMAGDETYGRYTAHRRMRWMTERLLEPLAADHPIASVQLQSYGRGGADG